MKLGSRPIKSRMRLVTRPLQPRGRNQVRRWIGILGMFHGPPFTAGESSGLPRNVLPGQSGRKMHLLAASGGPVRKAVRRCFIAQMSDRIAFACRTVKQGAEGGEAPLRPSACTTSNGRYRRN